MRVVLIANGAPQDPRPIEDWPVEWRLPVPGELIEIDPYGNRQVNHVKFVRRWDVRDGLNVTFWEAQIVVWGPAFDAPGS